jgi:hypothetical protein
MNDASSQPRSATTAEYLAHAPSDAEWAKRESERYRHLTPDQRFDVLTSLLQLMDELLAGRKPMPEPGLPFWRHWSDPELGRPG